jgi:hypothetical protein
MAARSKNTLQEVFDSWSSDAGQAMLVLPEEDAEILRQLLGAFRQILSDKANAQIQQQAAQQQQGYSMANPQPQMSPPPGVMPGMGSPPSPDELRRQIPGM